MFNSEDVYSAVAKSFFAEELGAEILKLSEAEFKAQFPDKRDVMKRCTLGIIYGITPHTLARYLETDLHHARQFLNRFRTVFPDVGRHAQTEVRNAAIRGYTLSRTGLRRRRPVKGYPRKWEPNWMVNAPIQMSAAAIFKTAGNRLNQLYSRYKARIIIPLHDAFVFEAPLDTLGEVARLTEQIMCQVVREHFPQLEPKVEVNMDHPDCWNAGHVDSLEKWLQEGATADIPAKEVAHAD